MHLSKRKERRFMRNILMTVMLLMVVVLMFTNIITSEEGIRAQIELKGSEASQDISGLNP
jgi:hypothetical protein